MNQLKKKDFLCFRWALAIIALINMVCLSCNQKKQEFDYKGHWYSISENENGELIYTEYFLDSSKWMIIKKGNIYLSEYEIINDSCFSVYNNSYVLQFRIIKTEREMMSIEKYSKLNYSQSINPIIKLHRLNTTKNLIKINSFDNLDQNFGYFNFENDSLKTLFWFDFSIRMEEAFKNH